MTVRPLIVALIIATSGQPAFVHEGETHVLARWTFDAWVVLPLALSAALYMRGVSRLWIHVGIGSGVHVWQVFAFALGWSLLVLALVSPLHWLGEHLFTVHMIEHEIVMAAAAPLLTVARPIGAVLWALPRSWRVALGRAARSRLVARAWRSVMDPLSATLLHGVVIWLWHSPALFELTVKNVGVHRLQHISFLMTALVFWWALLRQRRAQYGFAALCVFVTMTHTGLLGALLLFAPHVLFPIQTGSALNWGLTPIEDQQLAGLVMWVPAGALYAAIALAFFAAWIRSSGAGAVKVSRHAA